MPSLNDRVVLLTGGATGIGRAIALDMAAAGRLRHRKWPASRRSSHPTTPRS